MSGKIFSQSKLPKREHILWVVVLLTLLWSAAITYDKIEAETEFRFRNCILASINESLENPPPCWSSFLVKKLEKNDLDGFNSWADGETRQLLDSKGIFKYEFSEASRKTFPLTDQVIEVSRISGWLIPSRQRYYIFYLKGDVVGLCEGVSFKL